MADNFFLGGTGVFETDGNWSLAAEPAVGDNAIWDGRTNVDCTDDNHTSTAELMGDFIVEPQYTGSIGTAGAPLRLSAATFQMRGPGHLYFENGSTSDTARVIVNNQSCHAYLGANTAKIGIIEALAGDVTLTATLTGTDELWVGDANVTIVGANTLAAVHMLGKGNVTCLPAVTNLYHFGTGTFTQLPLGGLVSNMKIGPGAKVVYAAAGSPIVLAMIYDSGSLDASNVRAILTITTLWKGRNARFKQASTTLVTAEYPL